MARRQADRADAGMGTVTHGCGRHTEPSRRCYCVCGCRCADCREQHRVYNARLRRQDSYGQPRRVDAAPIRARIEQARKAGVGWKRMADLAGVSRSSFYKLLSGQSATVNISTARKILNVRLERADGAYIPAGEYVAVLDRLVRKGWTKSDLGAWLSRNPATRSLQVRGPNMQVATAKRIVELVNLIEADRVTCIGCGVHLRNRAVCGGCRVRRKLPA